jgi:hypothetical protein
VLLLLLLLLLLQAAVAWSHVAGRAVWHRQHSAHAHLLLQALVCKVDAQLLEAVVLELLKAIDVQDAEGGAVAALLAGRQRSVDLHAVQCSGVGNVSVGALCVWMWGM